MVKVTVIERRRFLFTTSALIGSGLATGIGTLALGGAAAYGASAMMGGGKKSSASAIPSIPSIGSAPGAGTEATSAEKARIRKKTKTILTGPLQGDEFASGPTLLGSGDATKKNVLG